MKKIICKTYEEMSALAAFTIALQIQAKPDSILGLATGSTPVGTYKRLVELYKDKFVDFSRVTTFNLDEYYPIEPTHPQSYRYFMQENLFDHVNIGKENTHFPGECTSEYDEKLTAAGGTDLQILGIGNNGHIAFIEPGERLPLGTSTVTLAQDTIEANSRFFNSADEVPKQARSMGVQGIFGSKHILLLISGKAKAEVTKKLFEGEVTTQIPATLLNLHPNVTVIMDAEAAGG
jgi:glucosamine-6-phosphate deaminase